MKEHGGKPKGQTNEEEIDNLPEKKFQDNDRKDDPKSRKYDRSR